MELEELFNNDVVSSEVSPDTPSPDPGPSRARPSRDTEPFPSTESIKAIGGIAKVFRDLIWEVTYFSPDSTTMQSVMTFRGIPIIEMNRRADSPPLTYLPGDGLLIPIIVNGEDCYYFVPDNLLTDVIHFEKNISD